MESDASAQAVEQVKPYILLVLDISGSMNSSVGSLPSCGGADTRANHAKCAIEKLVNTHGDVEFGFGIFRATQSGSCGSSCNTSGIDCNACDFTTGVGCTAGMSDADRLQMLVPLFEESSNSILPWVDLNCGSCTSENPANNPEVFVSGFTPLTGSLRGAKRYFQGNDATDSPTLTPIYGTSPMDPIRNDPHKTDFISTGNGSEQCRPYIVILLTDGDETCSMFDDGDRTNNNDTLDAAGLLLSTTVDARNYRIETKPIGFGKAPGDAQIEALAHAGGAADLVGNEGFYASDETSLSNAFNEIIAESVRTEVCDGVDNDCDGAVDEGFQLYCDKDGKFGPPTSTPTYCADPGDDCDGSDDNCFAGTTDEPTNACGFCGPTPTEVCNLLDDDCDGSVDEGNVCGGCTFFGAETCNNRDDDCDGSIDEGITRACGTDIGACTAGVETCVNGVFTNCTATGGSQEQCNNIDDDCNGTVDGFGAPCNTPDNPPPYQGVCQAGVHVCTAGAFGQCLGQVKKSGESCDGLDNDCDGTIDEDTGGGDCSGTCGTGTLVCDPTTHTLICSGGNTTATDEICNGLDDDCDGTIDEDVPPGGPCDNGGTLCVPGQLQCDSALGDYVCVGGEPPGPESCDCQDNDCDNTVDEGTLCGAGQACSEVDCKCVKTCNEIEFPCNPGFICTDGLCLTDPCFNVTCPPDGDGNAQKCVAGTCVSQCVGKTCPGSLVCNPANGRCVLDDCTSFPDKCKANQLCQAGVCVSNPCDGVSCPTDQYCLGGNCVGSCAGVECPPGQSCKAGACANDPCDGVTCGDAQVCDPSDGKCVKDKCTDVHCKPGEVCDPLSGTCGRDPCLGVICPGDQICTGGNCYDPGQVGADGGLIDHNYVSAGGGGGCDVGSSSAGLGLLLLGALTWLTRRARRGGAR